MVLSQALISSFLNLSRKLIPQILLSTDIDVLETCSLALSWLISFECLSFRVLENWQHQRLLRPHLCLYALWVWFVLDVTFILTVRLLSLVTSHRCVQVERRNRRALRLLRCQNAVLYQSKSLDCRWVWSIDWLTNWLRFYGTSAQDSSICAILRGGRGN